MPMNANRQMAAPNGVLSETSSGVAMSSREATAIRPMNNMVEPKIYRCLMSS